MKHTALTHLVMTSLFVASLPTVMSSTLESYVYTSDVKWTHPSPSYSGSAFSEAFRYKTLIGGTHVPTEGADVYFGEAEWAPGAIYVGHKHPAPEIYYVLSGTARWTIDGETFEAGPGTAIYTKPNAVHRMVNVGEGVLKTIWFWWAPNGDRVQLNAPPRIVERPEQQPARAKFTAPGALAQPDRR